jgi:hypothetical protein
VSAVHGSGGGGKPNARYVQHLASAYLSDTEPSRSSRTIVAASISSAIAFLVILILTILVFHFRRRRLQTLALSSPSSYDNKHPEKSKSTTSIYISGIPGIGPKCRMQSKARRLSREGPGGSHTGGHPVPRSPSPQSAKNSMESFVTGSSRTSSSLAPVQVQARDSVMMKLPPPPPPVSGSTVYPSAHGQKGKGNRISMPISISQPILQPNLNTSVHSGMGIGTGSGAQTRNTKSHSFTALFTKSSATVASQPSTAGAYEGYGMSISQVDDVGRGLESPLSPPPVASARSVPLRVVTGNHRLSVLPGLGIGSLPSPTRKPVPGYDAQKDVLIPSPSTSPSSLSLLSLSSAPTRLSSVEPSLAGVAGGGGDGGGLSNASEGYLRARSSGTGVSELYGGGNSCFSLPASNPSGAHPPAFGREGLERKRERPFIR